MKSSKLLITCEEATLLSVRKEDKNLSFKETFKWFLHLVICEFCRLFYKQQKFLSLQISKMHSHDSLSDPEIEKMNRIVNSHLD